MVAAGGKKTSFRLVRGICLMHQVVYLFRVIIKSVNEAIYQNPSGAESDC